VFALVGSHMAWTFRPYIVRPRTRDVPFIRSIEDGFFDSVARTSRSARGIYVRDEAPLPERDGEQR
jgi:hypothetical protein